MPQRPRKFERIGFVASDTPEASEARHRLVALYGDAKPDEADVIVALGGDGLMLQTLRRFLRASVPIYGMNLGTVGFLMNEFRAEDLTDRLARAEASRIHPLAMTARDATGSVHKDLAFNEVSLFRQTYQAAKLRIAIDGTVRMEELVCDGILVSTPAGSTAYNLSAHGPILPIDAPLLAMTPISPFRPRRWRGALLPRAARIRFDVLDAAKRPVSAVADHAEIRDVLQVDVVEDRRLALTLLFDPGHNLDERILSEQFRY
jgi:NAD+ kinase